MYKTVFLDYDTYGCEIQDGNVNVLNGILNEYYDKGWELVSLTTIPYQTDSSYCNFVLVLKSKNDEY